ncbi:MAG: beta-glucosidase BglX [Muribaculaceae bacterium]|nr:beta-glucosidase BglX [Muribaculaceae bacterium]
MILDRLFTAALFAGLCISPGYALTEQEIDKNVADLISKMTLEEKVGQLNQLSGYGYHPAMVGTITSGNVGSILNEVDPVVVNKLQREAVENTRMHIPLIFARDVIHGFKTIFPIPLGQACSWNEALVEEGARIAAEEASSVGIRWTFSPMVDIARDPRWGRMAEGFGEDPVLTTRLGLAMTKGYQGDDLTKPNTMAACAKHFAGYGASESGKDYNTTWIPDTYLRDVYLPPFEAQAKNGAATFMCSFNDINGVPSSGNRFLLHDVLRDEWGYDGLMVSDWGSIQQMIPHGYSADLRQAALQAAEAGVDIDMEGYAYISNLKDLVEKGELSQDVIDDLCANVLKLKYRLGLFENPYVDEKGVSFYQPSSLDAARRAVEESAVLLKNDGILPLQKNQKRIAVIGPMADAQHDQAGTWVFDFEKDHCVTPLTALRERYGNKNVTYVPGLTFSRERDTKGFAEAVKAAKEADVVLFFAGEEAVLSGEAHCRTDLTLPGAQKELMAELAATGTPVVLVIQAGRPLVINDEAAKAAAVVYCFHGGTMTGPGLANLLAGDVNFTGKLPVSFPKASAQVPIYYSHKNTGRPAAGITLIDDIELEAGQTSTGCTSYYLDCGDGPAYPFGFGESYTTYSYSTPRISSDTLTPEGTITVSCDVTNTGNVAGTEIVQMYVRDLVGSLVRPVKELKDFSRIELAPGETKTVEFSITPETLSFWNAKMQKVTEPGDFNVWIAPDSEKGESATFTYKN